MQFSIFSQNTKNKDFMSGTIKTQIDQTDPATVLIENKTMTPLIKACNHVIAVYSENKH